MDISAAQTAIAFALSGNWKEAVKINLEILADSPDDIDSLNRLAHGYAELGEISNAVAATKKALEIDPVNPIALKCAEKWKLGVNKSPLKTSLNSSETYLEEPGKTKLITLVNLGSPEAFSTLSPGEEVKLTCHTHKLSIISVTGKYIGKIPDELAIRLRNLMKAGNKYQALVKSVSAKEVTVFVREVERGVKAPDLPSFPTEKIDYVSFTPPELVHRDTPETSNPEEITED
jgi:tetratricopeptide (TPR) repeat protein